MQAAWAAGQDACSETVLLVGDRQDKVAHQLHYHQNNHITINICKVIHGK
jgi:hypothetical protein